MVQKKPCSLKELSISFLRIKPKVGKMCGTGFIYLEWTLLSTGEVGNLEYRPDLVYAKNISQAGVKKLWPLVSTAISLQILNEFTRTRICPSAELPNSSSADRSRTGLIKLKWYVYWWDFSFGRRTWILAFNVCSSFLTFYALTPRTFTCRW